MQWWNTTRIQKWLGYLGPDEYRTNTTAITYSLNNLSNVRGALHQPVGVLSNSFWQVWYPRARLMLICRGVTQVFSDRWIPHVFF